MIRSAPALACLIILLAPAGADEIDDLRRKANQEYAKELAGAVTFALGKGMVDQARPLVARIRELDENSSRLPSLERRLERAKPRVTRQSDQKRFDDRLEKAGREYAGTLLRVAKLLHGKKRDEELRTLLEEILVLDASLAKELEALGYGWTEETGLVDIETFRHIQKGEIPFQGRWIPADEMARMNQAHASFDDPWTLEGDHFRFTSSAPHDRIGKALAQCEKTHAFVYGLFGQKLAPMREKMKVHYFRTRDEMKARTNIRGVVTAQFSMDTQTINACDEITVKHPPAVNLCHETVHAVLLNVLQRREINADYWCCEGLAVYGEALSKFDSPPSPDYDVARSRRISEFLADFLGDRAHQTPLAELVSLGLYPFLSGDARGVIHRYQNSAAWAYFFLNHEDGKYRDRFLDYCVEAHKGLETSVFEAKMGLPPASFQQEFESFWKK